jgi:hypothetical protein
MYCAKRRGRNCVVGPQQMRQDRRSAAAAGIVDSNDAHGAVPTEAT